MGTGKLARKILHIGFSVLVFALVAFLLCRLGQKAYEFGYRVFTETAIDEEGEGVDKVVRITGDMGAKEIGSLLERKGLIRDANLFVVQLQFSSYAKSIKEGTYTLNTAMTAQEMMRAMSVVEAENTEEEEEEPASEDARADGTEEETETGPTDEMDGGPADGAGG